jgi:hypothetical protein
MKTASDLLPELRAWNDGRGITPVDYVFCVARSDIAASFIDLFWPRFVEFEGYVLREGFDEDNLRRWEAAASVTKQNIETAINFLDVGCLFSNSGEPKSELLDARIELVRTAIAEMYTAKLARDYPDRKFKVALIDDEDDCAVSFYQL